MRHNILQFKLKIVENGFTKVENGVVGLKMGIMSENGYHQVEKGFRNRLG